MKERDLLLPLTVAASGSLAARVIEAVALGEAAHSKRTLSLLNEPQQAMVTQLIALILPPPQFADECASGVPEFIDRIVTDWYTPIEQRIFADGLLDLDRDCLRRYYRNFVDCNLVQQAAALEAAERETRAAAPLDGAHVDEHSPFITKLMELAVLGYYTAAAAAADGGEAP